MSINWVMIPEDLSRPFVPLPREREVFASPVRTSFSLKSPKPPPPSTTTTTSTSTTSTDDSSSSAVDFSSATGIAYVTTQRVVYLPHPPGRAELGALQSFSVPLLRLHDARVTAPFFGPNVLVGAVQPVRDGGLPTPQHAPYTLELRLTFRDGGAYDFHARFCELRERAVQAREIVHEIGRNAEHQEVHGEQLPAYEERGERGDQGRVEETRQSARQRPEAVNGSTTHPSGSGNAPGTGPPEEAPPGYEEAITS